MVFIPSYFDLMISAILVIQFGEWNTWGEKLSLAMSIFTLVFGMLFITIVSFWMIFQTKKELNSRKTKIG